MSQKGGLIPLEVLLGNPERALVQVSHDGTRLSWCAPVDGVLNVWVQTIGKDDAAPVTNDRDRGIRSYHWAYDHRHLVYLQDEGGDENWHLHVVDLDSGEDRDVTPFDGVQAQIVDADRNRPDECLVGVNRDNPQLHDLYRLTISTGELELVAKNPGFVQWITDNDLNVRGGVGMQPDGSVVMVMGDEPDPTTWQPVGTWSHEDALVMGPVGFSADNRSLYLVDPRDANASRLVRLDLDSGDIEVLYEDGTYDCLGSSNHPETRVPQLALVTRARSEYEVLDPDLAPDMEALRAVQGGDVDVLSRSDDDGVWIVAYNPADGPVSYYVWDRAEQQATFLFDARPELRQYDLADMEPFSFTARDGLEVHGYLSFPAGAERSGLPTVLNVHGGPWTRDQWGFDPEAQWLANRGYLCVQVNYRGSIGYGKEFVNAGDREWGGKMHDDLIDAVNHLVAEGYADPERIAIFGGSYGGYAALLGATFTPDVFRCSVAIVGPSNLKTFIETIPEYWVPMIAMMHHRVGNPETDEEFLWSRSPLSRVDDIRIPMLIAHGANDPRVKQSESEQIVAAMNEKGIDHDYLLFPDEGHGFAKPENRMKFYGAAEQFLARHLGGRSAS